MPYLGFNENGILAEFQDYTCNVRCRQCGKSYYQKCIEQIPGFREVDEDICPYCHKSNGCSGDYEFFNYKLED